MKLICRILGHHPVTVITKARLLDAGSWLILGTAGQCSRCGAALPAATTHPQRWRSA